MKKKLKIQFIRNKECLAFCVLEQKGLPKERTDGRVSIVGFPTLDKDCIGLRGSLSEYDFDFARHSFDSATEAAERIRFFVDIITKELFSDGVNTVAGLKAGDECFVRDSGWDSWNKAVYVCKFRSKFVCESEPGYKVFYGWSFCRPAGAYYDFSCRTMPSCPRGVEVTTCTWEEVE